ncbi:hypothetical protein JZ751_005924 [Albula glossodonta]|uniref:Uncharacterized protein n=1 Tax=Albula glossodonta TaxID=121402 RepID=A0A8T2PE22_9TELE|nr:hypothetical protein JZ751_005924 [Albula glossodonta]
MPCSDFALRRGPLPAGKRGPSLTFSGNGYVKYRLTENENKEEMKLSLKLRTFSSHATVMYARGTDYSILEIQNGRLQYRFDCGSGPGLVSVHSVQVNDGEWHTVLLHVEGNYAKLVLDRDHTAAGTAPGALRTLNLDNVVFFGGHIRQHAARKGRSPAAGNGFRGCMEALVLNDQDLPLSINAKGPRTRAVMEDVVDVSPGCTMAPPQGCSSDPCTNGGTCSALPNGEYFCKCGALFMGTHCEVPISPCASNPCLYGGTCVPRRDNPCKNSGTCIDSLDGPVCECEPGFQGERCLSDVDECVENPCSNGGKCENTYGSYRCNCSLGFAGKLCELKSAVRNEFISTSWNIGLEEVIGIVIFVASIFILVLLFIIIRKGCCQSGRSKADQDKHGPSNSFLHGPYLDPKLSKNIYSDVPPQVPVRPISYTPSIPSDSRNNLDRNSFEGSIIPEHPEFSTFNPDAVHGHRKAVAVCSVAPNLPPPPPSNPPSDSDSIQKPTWEYEYDAKVVELDPCLKKKHIAESTYRRISDVHSLGSFHSETYDDNGYHWDTSDWMPNVLLPGIQEFPQYGAVESPPPLYSDPKLIETDYYLGGYDIESDVLPPPNDFPIHEELPPLPEQGDQYGTMRPTRGSPPPPSPHSPKQSQQQLYSIHRYLPHHQYPTDLPRPHDQDPGTKVHSSGFPIYPMGHRQDFRSSSGDGVPLSTYTVAASTSDVSDIMISDYESGDEGRCGHVTAPEHTHTSESPQHTEV